MTTARPKRCTAALPVGTDGPCRRTRDATILVAEVVQMKIWLRDWIATLLVAAIVIPYIGYLVDGSMPFIQDPTGMAAVGIVLALVAVSVIGPDAFRGPWGRTAVITGAAAVVLGVATVFLGEAWAIGEVLVACFVGAVVLTWLIAVLVDTCVLSPDRRRPAHR